MHVRAASVIADGVIDRADDVELGVASAIADRRLHGGLHADVLEEWTSPTDEPMRESA